MRFLKIAFVFDQQSVRNRSCVPAVRGFEEVKSNRVLPSKAEGSEITAMISAWVPSRVCLADARVANNAIGS